MSLVWKRIALMLVVALAAGAAAIVLYRRTRPNKGMSDVIANIVATPLVAQLVTKLPAESRSSEFSVRQDVSIFDLRGWQPVPPELRDSAVSPAQYTNVLRVVRHTGTGHFVAHFATTGVRIDFLCISHSCQVFHLKPGDPAAQHRTGIAAAPEPATQEYAVDLDLSESPVESDITVVLQATYWNGFRDPATGSAETYADEDASDLEDLRLVVFLPRTKAWTAYSLFTHPEDGSPQPFNGGGRLRSDSTKTWLDWQISKPRAGYHYGIEWRW